MYFIQDLFFSFALTYDQICNITLLKRQSRPVFTKWIKSACKKARRSRHQSDDTLIIINNAMKRFFQLLESFVFLELREDFLEEHDGVENPTPEEGKERNLQN